MSHRAASSASSDLKVLSKEAGDTSSCIELRDSHEAMALALVDLDLMRGSLLLQQTFDRVSMRDPHDVI